MGEKKLPQPKFRSSLSISEVARDNLRGLWDRAAKIAVPIGAVGGFAGDVLSPLGPVVAQLAIVFGVLCLISGVIWYGIKRRQISVALRDGHIDENEYHVITASSRWPTVFAFTLIATVVLTLFFGAQKVLASDEPEKGAAASVFPFIARVQEQLLNLQRTADSIKADTGEIKKSLDALTAKLEKLDQGADIIAAPTTPEDHYFNARLFEFRNEAGKARQSYMEYMKSDLPYVDPHLQLSALMKLQDGRASAHEAYAMFVKNRNPSALLARALLLEKPGRTAALESLAKDFPEYGPVYFFLAKEFTPESGQQTLENMKAEKAALEKLRALDDRGLFTKYFLDKRLAVIFSAEVQTRLGKFATLSDGYLNAAAKLVVLPTETGWEGVVTLPYDGAELFLKMPGENEFKSTGFTEKVSPSTGKPLPRTQVPLTGVRKGTIEMKYRDTQGAERGPFKTEFDPIKEFVAFAKKIMPSDPRELAPLRQWKGKKTVSMVQLLMFRAAINNVTVGPDPKHLEKTLELGAPSSDFKVLEVQADDPRVAQELPAWDKVFLRVDFADGSTGEPIALE